MRKIMWHPIEEKPVKVGIYVVARFEGDSMIELDTNWAFCDDYFGPNNVGWQVRIKPTHWMTYTEYRAVLENTPRG